MYHSGSSAKYQLNINVPAEIILTKTHTNG